MATRKCAELAGMCLGALALASAASAGTITYESTAFGQAEPNIEKICFDADGVMFIGNDNGDEDSEAVNIWRLTCWGGDAVPFGPPLTDPDAVGVDIDGSLCGVSGAVLVGGNDFDTDDGYIRALDPCTGELIEGCGWEGLNPPNNIGDLAFDSQGRLLIVGMGLYVGTSVDSPPNLLFGMFMDGPQNVAVNDSNEIFTTTSSGEISHYLADGTPIDLTFATGLGFITGLVFGPGGIWGDDLYAANTDGDLYRVNTAGESELVLSGLGKVADIAFGPGNALFVGEELTGAISRIEARQCVTDLNGDGFVDAVDLAQLLGSWGTCE